MTGRAATQLAYRLAIQTNGQFISFGHLVIPAWPPGTWLKLTRPLFRTSTKKKTQIEPQQPIDKTSIPELWSHTCSFLGSENLEELARTSSIILYQTRPIHYEHVHLCSDREAPPATPALLKKNKTLAAKVNTIHLANHQDPDDRYQKQWLHIGIFWGMSQPRVLSMFCPPFETKLEQERFISRPKRSCKLIREVTYKADYSSDLWNISNLTCDNFEIAGLTKVFGMMSMGSPNLCYGSTSCVVGVDSFASRHLLSLMKASADVPVHLCPPSACEEIGSKRLPDLLKDCRFSHLKIFNTSLTLWGYEGARHFLKFLITHHSSRSYLYESILTTTITNAWKGT